MAIVQEATVTLNPLLGNQSDGLARILNLSKANPSIHLGRSSRAHSKNRVPAEDNGWLDSPVISKDHAKIFIGKNGDICVIDTGSTHGTYVDDHALVKEQPYVLHGDSTLKFGTTVCRDTETFHAQSFRVSVNIGPSYIPTSQPASPITKTPSIISPNRSFKVPEYDPELSDSDGSGSSNEVSRVEDSVPQPRRNRSFSVPESVGDSSDESSNYGGYSLGAENDEELTSLGKAVSRTAELVEVAVNSGVNEVIDITGIDDDISTRNEASDEYNPEDINQSTGNDWTVGFEPMSEAHWDEELIVEGEINMPFAVDAAPAAADVEYISPDRNVAGGQSPINISVDGLKGDSRYETDARRELENPVESAPSRSGLNGSLFSNEQVNRTSKVSITSLINPVAQCETATGQLKRKRSVELESVAPHGVTWEGESFPDAQPPDRLPAFPDDTLTASSTSLAADKGGESFTEAVEQPPSPNFVTPAKRARTGRGVLRTATTALAGAVLGSFGTIWALAQMQEREMASS